MTAAGLRALLAKATPGPWMSGGEAGIALTFDREINILPPDTMESHGFQYGGPVAVVSTGGEGENADLIVALRNAAERFAELLEREEVGIWSAPIDGKVWLNLHRGKEHVGVIIYRKSENDYYWNAMGCGNHCSTEAEARAAVEAAVRAGR